MSQGKQLKAQAYQNVPKEAQNELESEETILKNQSNDSVFFLSNVKSLRICVAVLLLLLVMLLIAFLITICRSQSRMTERQSDFKPKTQQISKRTQLAHSKQNAKSNRVPESQSISEPAVKSATQQIEQTHTQFEKQSSQSKKPRLQKVFIPPVNIPQTSATPTYPLKFPYPTIGIPEPGKFFNSTIVQEKDLIQFGNIFNELMKPYNDSECRLQRYGKEYKSIFPKEKVIEDDSYVVCDNYFAQADAMINLGINGHDYFGCQVVYRYPLLNYQYDCTNPRVPVCDRLSDDVTAKKNSQERNQFHNICMGTFTAHGGKNRTFYTLQDIIKAHNLTDKRIILKMDCEGCEYYGLKYVPTSILDNIDVIIAEIHLERTVRQRWGHLDIIKTLASKFVNVNYHIQYLGCFKEKQLKVRSVPGGSVEVTLINRRLIKLRSESRSFALSPENYGGCAPQGNVIPW